MCLQSQRRLSHVGKEEVIGVIVEDFVDDSRLNFGSGGHAHCGVLGLKELTDICIIPMPLVSLVIMDVRLAFGMGGGFCLSILLVELDFRPSMPEPRGGSQENDIHRDMCVFIARHFQSHVE